jgi:hypothetical protein
MLGLHSGGQQQSNYIAKLDKKHLLPMWSFLSRQVDDIQQTPADDLTDIELAYNKVTDKFYYVCNYIDMVPPEVEPSTPRLGRIDAAGAFTSYYMPVIPAQTGRLGSLSPAINKAGTLVLPWYASRGIEPLYWDVYGTTTPDGNLGLAATYNKDVAYVSPSQTDHGDMNIRAATDRNGETWVISDQEEKHAYLRNITDSFTKGTPIASLLPRSAVAPVNAWTSDIAIGDDSDIIYTSLFAVGDADNVATIGQYDAAHDDWAYTDLTVANNRFGTVAAAPARKLSLGIDTRNRVYVGSDAQVLSHYIAGVRDPQPNEFGVVRINGQYNFHDGIADDADLTKFDMIDLMLGSPWLVNKSFGLTKYDTDIQIQAQGYIGGMRADNSGNVFVTGYGQALLQLELEQQSQFQVQEVSFVARIRGDRVFSRMYRGQVAATDDFVPLKDEVVALIDPEAGVLHGNGGMDVSCADERGRRNYQ